MSTLDFLKRQVGVFKDFSDEHLQQLLNGSRIASFEAGEAVAHQGVEATHFGVVLSGTVAASVQGNGGVRQALGKLKAGDTFGEMALMTGDTLLADFIAESRCEVLQIPVSLFQCVIVAEPRAVRHISQTISERMKLVFADPAKAATALQKSDDPYGLKQNADIFRFFKLMIAFRKAHPSIGRATFWREDVQWFGPDGPVDFGPESRCLAYLLRGEPVGDEDLYVMINAHWNDQRFAVQEGKPCEWPRVVDTARASPHDLAEPGSETKLKTGEINVQARSVVVLKRERK